MTVDLLLHFPLLGEESIEVGVGLGEGSGDRVEAIEQVAQRPDAVLDVSANVFGGIEVGLCGSQPTVAPAASSALPLEGSSTPAMIRSSVDFPAPLGPSTPIFAPGRNASVMLSSTLRSGP